MCSKLPPAFLEKKTAIRMHSKPPAFLAISLMIFDPSRGMCEASSSLMAPLLVQTVNHRLFIVDFDSSRHEHDSYNVRIPDKNVGD